MHILVTLNVFQNSLTSHDPCWRYYANLLRSLSSRSVTWYMTKTDFEGARSYFVEFGAEIDETCQEVYLSLLSRVQVCHIDDRILEEAALYGLNFPDRIRLACAIDYNLEGIVTYEPQQFALTVEDVYRLQLDGYFPVCMISECLDAGFCVEKRLHIFSVASFLINLDETSIHLPYQLQSSEVFQLKEFHIICENEISEAAITLQVLDNLRLEATAIGKTPFEAIQLAIDSIVNHCVEMPARRLSSYSIPPATLSGAEAPVAVVICIECAGLYFEKSACSGNSIKAAANAYVKVVNAICDRLNLSLFMRQEDET